MKNLKLNLSLLAALMTLFIACEKDTGLDDALLNETIQNTYENLEAPSEPPAEVIIMAEEIMAQGKPDTEEIQTSNRSNELVGWKNTPRLGWVYYFGNAWPGWALRNNSLIFTPDNPFAYSFRTKFRAYSGICGEPANTWFADDEYGDDEIFLYHKGYAISCTEG